MGLLQSYKNFYLKNHAILLWIPIAVTVIALIMLGIHYQTTGDILNKDVSLKGGITATIYTQQTINPEQLQQTLKQIFGDVEVKQLAEFGSETPLGIIIETTASDEQLLKTTLEKELQITLNENNYSVEVVGSSLGESFYQQMLIAILISFLLMGIVVLFIYRTFIPSIAVIGAAFADVVITMAILNFTNIKINTAGISALLLLIGYSVDSDILQTTKMLKRTENTVEERMFESVKTTMTMTIAMVGALIIGVLLSTSTTIKEMFLIMLIGLIVDAFYTYWTNSGILLWYANKRKKA
ncbi:MAG: hypothetical protein Q7R96_04620 [Nanoarchaeota archaeon]|nr:hypothetical protein [Nanoarchaeota archaeon]